jgi:transcriptional regulator GlxA family with amidase domain
MSEDTLKKVAAECGFGNKSRLASLFRNATELPPGQWRRMHAAGVQGGTSAACWMPRCEPA